MIAQQGERPSGEFLGALFGVWDIIIDGDVVSADVEIVNFRQVDFIVKSLLRGDWCKVTP